MKKYINLFLSHPLIKGTTIIFVGGTITSLLMYAFTIFILGRFFIASDFGTYSALMAFLSIFGIFSSTFTMSFTKYAAMYKAQEDSQKMNILFASGFRFVTLFSTILLILLCLSITLFSSFLQIPDIRLLILTFLSLFLTILVSLPIGTLTGEMRLYTLSLVNIANPIFKIIIGFLLLFFGWKIFGVTIAVFISSLLTFIFLLILFRKRYSTQVVSRHDQHIFLREFKKYSFQFFLSSIGITILTSADILFVKHYFSPVEAGQYAAISLMGRSIFYLTAPILSVFFPLIAQKIEKKENIHTTLFLASALITLASVTLSFIYFLFPTVILRIFFPGQEYKSLTSYLGPYSLYTIIFSLMMLFNNFLLAIGKSEVYKINLLVAGLFVILMYLFHTSFYQVIGVLFGTSLLLLVLHLLYYVKTYHARK
ncbi:oligosaccharide flippase family protein [soil metagenome]